MEDRFIYYHTNRYNLPDYGFKIHISATDLNYDKIIKIVNNYLSHKELHWKKLKSKKEFIKNILKTEAPAESGKLFTIYPPNIEECETIMNDVSKLLKNESGIYILSDRNFGNSKTVYYRFGFFKYINNCTLDNGSDIWIDYQKNYFDLPKWFDDPFLKKSDDENYANQLSKFSLSKIIHQTNAGNIYSGSLQGQQIILKETRPNILAAEHILCKDLRDKEYKISELLHSKNFQLPICKFESWINTYYCYKYFNGITLTKWQQKLNLFENINSDKIIKFISVVKNLMDVLQEAHSKDVVLDDIHPDNFLIDDNQNVCFIDLEYACFSGGKQVITAKTPGYYLSEWNNLSGKIKDLRKLGEIVLYLLNQMNVFDNEDETILEKISMVDILFKRFEFRSNISTYLYYLLIHGDSIEEAILIFDNVTFDKISKETEPFLLINAVNMQNLETKQDIIKYISEHSFKEYGLDGLTGYLWNLYQKNGQKNSKFIDGKISEVLTQINNSYLQLGSGYYSPYIVNGSAGVGLFLMIYNYEKYVKEILDIAEGMNVSIGKSVTFAKGLCGIAYFLIILYTKTLNKKYLDWADEQIETCNLFSRNGKLYDFASKCYQVDFSNGYDGLSYVERIRRTV